MTEPMTELFDADIDRVDLVGAAANGRKFLIAKSAPIIPADMVRALITKEQPSMAETENAAVEAETVAKDAVDPEQQPETDITAPEPVEKSADEALAEVAKADGLIAVYDATGCLVGVVKPNAITPVEGPGTTDPDDDGDSVEDVDGDGDGVIPEDAAPVEEAAATLTDADGSNQIDTDATPVEEAAADADAPADDASDDEDDEDSRVIPGTHTVQAPVTKEATTAPETDIAAVLKEYLAPLAEELRKTASLAETVQALEERVEKFGAQPDTRNLPRLHGATGSNTGLSPRDGEAQDALEPLKKALADATASGDPAAIHKANADLLFESVRARFTN